MERVLALDVGDARVGVAVSDPLGITAQPSGFFPRVGARADLARVRDLVARHGAVRVVVGHPLLLSGEAGARARDAETFAEKLRDGLGGIGVDLWDERLTTAQAEREMIEGGVRRKRRKEAVDAVAAALILQSWLDAHRGSANGIGA